MLCISSCPKLCTFVVMPGNKGKGLFLFIVVRKRFPTVGCFFFPPSCVISCVILGEIQDLLYDFPCIFSGKRWPAQYFWFFHEAQSNWGLTGKVSDAWLLHKFFGLKDGWPRLGFLLNLNGSSCLRFTCSQKSKGYPSCSLELILSLWKPSLPLTWSISAVLNM